MTHIGVGMFRLEVLQHLKTRSCLVSMFTNHHTLCPQCKGVLVKSVIAIQSAICGDAGDK
jgi:hypothetical protein